MMCAYGDDGEDACSGDSGGKKNPLKWTLYVFKQKFSLIKTPKNESGFKSLKK